MPDRSFNTTAIRYTFNGKEDEIFSEWQDYGFRNYDKKQRRFTSVDPLTEDYPELTTFQFANNLPIEAIDLDGLEDWSSKDGQQALNEKGQPIVGPLRNEVKKSMTLLERAQGTAPFTLINTALRLKYVLDVAKLKPYYSATEVTDQHKTGVEKRVEYKNRTRDLSIGNRTFLDKIDPVKRKYVKPHYQTYNQYDMGHVPPRPNNPRFYTTNIGVNAFSGLTIGFSGYNLYSTGSRLYEAHGNGTLSYQSQIESGAWAGGWAGIKLGGAFMSKFPIKHPAAALIGVGIFGATGAILGSNAVEKFTQPIGYKVNLIEYQKRRTTFQSDRPNANSRSYE